MTYRPNFLPVCRDYPYPTHQSLFPEVDAHSGDKLLLEDSLGVVVEEAGLAHPRVPQSQELYQVVVVFPGTTHLPQEGRILVLQGEGMEVKSIMNTKKFGLRERN